jgi:hypothetical protein
MFPLQQASMGLGGLISTNLLWLKCLVRKGYPSNIDLGYTWRLWECICILGFLWWWIFAIFCQKYFERWILCHNFPVFLIKESSENMFLNSLKSSQLPKKGVYEFLLSYFECHQIWLNLLMDDHHLSNITKQRVCLWQWEFICN